MTEIKKGGLSTFFASVLSVVTENERTSEEIYFSYKDKLSKNRFNKIIGYPVSLVEIESTLLYLVKEGYIKKSQTNFIFGPLPFEVNLYHLTKKGIDSISLKK